MSCTPKGGQALFLGKDDSDNTPKKFINRLKEYDQYLNGIKIEDCTDNRQAEGTDLVRVFYLSKVKGMEFEVALFHNIDNAFDDEDDNLIRRYLYVGISRATTHLAATFEKEDGNESIIKYFDRNATSWLQRIRLSFDKLLRLVILNISKLWTQTNLFLLQS